MEQQILIPFDRDAGSTSGSQTVAFERGILFSLHEIIVICVTGEN